MRLPNSLVLCVLENKKIFWVLPWIIYQRALTTKPFDGYLRPLEEFLFMFSSRNNILFEFICLSKENFLIGKLYRYVWPTLFVNVKKLYEFK